jgi:hypothetical protein
MAGHGQRAGAQVRARRPAGKRDLPRVRAGNNLFATRAIPLVRAQVRDVFSRRDDFLDVLVKGLEAEQRR